MNAFFSRVRFFFLFISNMLTKVASSRSNRPPSVPWNIRHQRTGLFFFFLYIYTLNFIFALKTKPREQQQQLHQRQQRRERNDDKLLKRIFSACCQKQFMWREKVFPVRVETFLFWRSKPEKTLCYSVCLDSGSMAAAHRPLVATLYNYNSIFLNFY